MSKQEAIIISVLCVAIFALLIVISMPANMRMDKKSSAPANVLSSGGGPGSGKGQFSTPRDVAVDKDGNIYVVDSRNSRIQKFGPTGNFIVSWGKEGDKPGDLKEPAGIDIGPDGNIYIAATWPMPGRVCVYDPNGKFIKEFGKEKGLWGPRDLAVDKNGFVYICDTGNCKIEKFSNDGKWIQTIGKKGKNSGEFNEPFGIKVAPDGNLYIADRKNFRVQIMSPTGAYVNQIKIEGWGEGQIVNGCLMEPYLDIDASRGLLYVTDSTNQRVLRYNLKGKDKKIFYKDEKGMNMFGCPEGIAVNTNGTILVTDTGMGKLIMFSDK